MEMPIATLVIKLHDRYGSPIKTAPGDMAAYVVAAGGTSILYVDRVAGNDVWAIFA